MALQQTAAKSLGMAAGILVIGLGLWLGNATGATQSADTAKAQCRADIAGYAGNSSLEGIPPPQAIRWVRTVEICRSQDDAVIAALVADVAASQIASRR